MFINTTLKYVAGTILILFFAVLLTTFAFAQSSTDASIAACLGVAVNTREQALDTAMNTYTQSIDSAYSLRANSLVSAYAQTSDTAALKTSVRDAWSHFSSSLKQSKATWKASRNSTWKTFKKAAVACKATQALSDSDHSIQEASGN